MSENFTPEDLRALADYMELLWGQRGDTPRPAAPIVTLWADRPDETPAPYCWIDLNPRNSDPIASFFDPIAAEFAEAANQPTPTPPTAGSSAFEEQA